MPAPNEKPIIGSIVTPQTIFVCYDCKTEITDYAIEARQTSGGDGVVYSGDFTNVHVHANRRECMAAKQQRIEEEKRQRIPFYDVAAC